MIESIIKANELPAEFPSEEFVAACSHDEYGYLVFFNPNLPISRKNGMVVLARYIESIKKQRWLTSDELVVYADGNRSNVSVENLQVMSRADLGKMHNHQVSKVCPVCGCVYFVSKSHEFRRVTCSNDCKLIYIKKRSYPDNETMRFMLLSMPAEEVAQELGVSGSYLARYCKLHGIDKPGRGLWARMRKFCTDKKISLEDVNPGLWGEMRCAGY